MFHEHRPTKRCPTCADWPEWVVLILDKLGEIMSDQEHLDADVKALGDAIAAEVAELKAQITAGTPAAQLDFTALDKLAVDTAAAATADAPPAPVVPPVPTA
jgi:hypothetical protein